MRGQHLILIVILHLVFFSINDTIAFTLPPPISPLTPMVGGSIITRSGKLQNNPNKQFTNNNRVNISPHNIYRLHLMNTAATVTASNNVLFHQIKTLVSTLSNATAGTNALQAVKELLMNTSPSIYFTCLIVAGLGVPISEDALCIFVGSILPVVWNENPVFRTKLLLALYFGIVLSDIVTFSIGRVMGMGLLEPVRKRMNLRTERIEFCEDEDDEEVKEMNVEEGEELSMTEEEENNLEGNDKFCEIPTPDLRSKDKSIAILNTVGNYAGFVVRFSVGMRLPMMLATGFSGKVPLNRFIVGTSIGAIFSLSVQLGLGALMSNNPAMIITTVACISATPVVIPSLVAFLSWINIMYKRWSMFRPR